MFVCVCVFACLRAYGVRPARRVWERERTFARACVCSARVRACVRAFVLVCFRACMCGARVGGCARVRVCVLWRACVLASLRACVRPVRTCVRASAGRVLINPPPPPSPPPAVHTHTHPHTRARARARAPGWHVRQRLIPPSSSLCWCRGRRGIRAAVLRLATIQPTSTYRN